MSVISLLQMKIAKIESNQQYRQGADNDNFKQHGADNDNCKCKIQFA